MGPSGSDAGIVNVCSLTTFSSYRLFTFQLQVNVGTSGAEIGAAFGGNKVSLTILSETQQ